MAASRCTSRVPDLGPPAVVHDSDRQRRSGRQGGRALPPPAARTRRRSRRPTRVASSRPSRAAAPRWARRRHVHRATSPTRATRPTATRSATSGTWPTTTYDATCTTPLTTTPTVAGGARRRLRQGRRAGGAANDAKDTTHLTATSCADPSVSAVGDAHDDRRGVRHAARRRRHQRPGRLGAVLQGRHGRAGSLRLLGPRRGPEPAAVLPHGAQERRVVDRQRLPGSDHPVRERAQGLPRRWRTTVMSGQDILDQAAGTTAFVHDYLHIAWDGTEVQNDKANRRGHGGRRQPGHRRHRHRAGRPQRPRG